MGRNNKQRRAAKQRKRRQRAAGPRPAGAAEPSGAGFGAPFGADSPDAYALAEMHLFSAVRRIGRRRLDRDELHRSAEMLLRRLHPIPVHVPAAVLGALLERLTDGLLDGGWSPSDLAELVDRNAEPAHRPTLAALLREHARRRRTDTADWRAAVDAVAADEPLRLGTTAGLASGLQLAALFNRTPVMEAGAYADQVTSTPRASEHPKLAQVRALLAKAESTPFEEEAEALSAKAQELITRYALEHLLEQRQSGASSGLTARRVWLDPPYVRAKAALVHEVASANRCRSASCDELDFCVVVGTAPDLDAVELLVTSLLVQADVAMLVHGRRVDESGASRTRSFRRSFLLAYAVRIGERLRAATSEVIAADADDRLPVVLRDHEDRVAEAFDAVVPHTEAKATTISNGAGWAAGTAAADLASLDIHGKLTDRAG